MLLDLRSLVDGSIRGSGNVTAPAIALAGAGSLELTGTSSVTAPAPALAGIGAQTFSGTGAESFAFALAGTGAQTFTGTGALAFAALSLNATGTQTFTGAADLTFSTLALSATGALTFTGTGAVSFVTLVAATGALTFTGTGDTAFAVPALSADGAVEFDENARTGTGDITFGLELSGTGEVTAPVVALRGAFAHRHRYETPRSVPAPEPVRKPAIFAGGRVRSAAPKVSGFGEVVNPYVFDPTEDDMLLELELV